MSKEISTKALAERILEGNTAVVDVRSAEAYNGWQIRGESRGGHILSARSLPARWASYLDWIDIVRSKGIAPHQPIVLYGYDPQESMRIAKQFERAGYIDIYYYHGFIREWSADSKLSMDKLPRYQQLVSSSWLKELIETGSAPEFQNGPFVLCHAHYRNPADYDIGHIPGALSLDTNTLESSSTWNCRTPAELKVALAALGITRNSTVVLYGRCSFPRKDEPFPGSSAGHLGAMRCALILLYAGVEDVRILNGGLQSWVDAGYQLTRQPAAPVEARDFGGPIPGRPELLVSLAEAKRILASSNANLISVRSWLEYTGEVSGYNYIDRKGCIPGSVFADCGSDAYHMENYRNPDHTCREYHEVSFAWYKLGVVPERLNAFYCGTGWRASEAFFNAWLMGWPSLAVYDGGWYEWSRHADNSIQRGERIGEASHEY